MFFGSVEKPPRLSEFELEVPDKLIAKDPLKKRDQCSLMVLNRKEQTIEHRKFSNIILSKNFFLVISLPNNSTLGLYLLNIFLTFRQLTHFSLE